MLTKSDILKIQSLKDKKVRYESGLFLVETPKLINELIDSAFEIEKIYTTEEHWIEKKSKNLEIEIISEKELSRISQLKTPHLAVALAKKKLVAPYNKTEGITLVLDGIQNPGNVGTIIRIADWFAVKKIVASLDTADAFGPKVVQATMGSIFRIPIEYTDLTTFLTDNTLPVYGALLNGEDAFENGKIENGILIIGNESQGIRKEIKHFITKALTIPRFGKAESLNAAVATGIMLSHLV